MNIVKGSYQLARARHVQLHQHSGGAEMTNTGATSRLWAHLPGFHLHAIKMGLS